MQQITVISGKGGTGKTTYTSAFASLAQDAVFADCDVDAANLYLVLRPENYREEVFPGAQTAVIDYDKCTNCGICQDVCRFDAISWNAGQIEISEFACDGCELCMHVCPFGAIKMEQSYDSRWFIGNTRFGPMVHAKLGIAEDLSGKLVTVVREEAKKLAEKESRQQIIIDGPPGIGCPVIASVTGTDKVVTITEPSQSGLHDLKRVAEMVGNFDLVPYVVINKFDVNKMMTREIEKYCDQYGIPVIGKVPFDQSMVEAMVEQKSVIEYAPSSKISKLLKDIWRNVNE
ncbi:MAG: 4Fe-4S binding protein [Bacteroidales bacterium]|nr:4Fe-4S binding protein [Bacteroidales bacterium]MCF8337732.1 4Fe-4S binding protein [Bacteroidales bacterium]